MHQIDILITRRTREWEGQLQALRTQLQSKESEVSAVRVAMQERNTLVCAHVWERVSEIFSFTSNLSFTSPFLPPSLPPSLSPFSLSDPSPPPFPLSLLSSFLPPSLPPSFPPSSKIEQLKYQCVVAEQEEKTRKEECETKVSKLRKEVLHTVCFLKFNFKF